jgi:hypothetical protein
MRNVAVKIKNKWSVLIILILVILSSIIIFFFKDNIFLSRLVIPLPLVDSFSLDYKQYPDFAKLKNCREKKLVLKGNDLNRIFNKKKYIPDQKYIVIINSKISKFYYCYGGISSEWFSDDEVVICVSPKIEPNKILIYEIPSKYSNFNFFR